MQHPEKCRKKRLRKYNLISAIPQIVPPQRANAVVRFRATPLDSRTPPRIRNPFHSVRPFKGRPRYMLSPYSSGRYFRNETSKLAALICDRIESYRRLEGKATFNIAPRRNCSDLIWNTAHIHAGAIILLNFTCAIVPCVIRSVFCAAENSNAGRTQIRYTIDTQINAKYADLFRLLQKYLKPTRVEPEIGAR